MADFEYAFASSGTPTSFPIGDSGVTGIDEAGTITPKAIKLGDNVHVLLTATKTDAEIVELMRAFGSRYGAFHEGAGGAPAQATLQVALTETEVVAAD
jgi:hypothetical protein